MAAPHGETEDYVWASVGPLPVELLSFTGREEADHVRLEWTTASETGSERFVVERTQDMERFEAVGALPAAGYSTSPRDYVLFDERPLIGVTYYTLIQEDINGDSERYGPIAVRFQGKEGKWVDQWPMDRVRVHGSMLEEAPMIMDMTGRLLDMSVDPSGLITRDALPAGVYTIQWLGAQGVAESLRFMMR
ncbi:MAG: hypothetical protein IPJ85_11705 [Flavobacteriales bacterium]|nr:hypothetical protein [Flavobacteriales bacterium]